MSKRESLLARSERVIGRPLDETGQSSNSDSPQSSSNRRAQILRAQRTHRHRTQQYIRELEKEVFRLRDENETYRKSHLRFQSHLSQLRQVLDENNIPVDVDLELELGQELSQDLAQGPSTAVPDKVLRVDLTELAQVMPQGSCENHPAEIDPPFYQSPSQSVTPSQDSPTQQSSQAAINFVLALEKPCLPHVKHAHLGYSTGTTPRGIDYNSGPGHVLTTSANLIHRFHDQNPATAILDISKSDIDSLLAASAHLRLDNEITPVQIWARIHEVESVSDQELEILLAEFCKYVYCNSFGAVVEKSTAMAILANTFGDRVGWSQAP